MIFWKNEGCREYWKEFWILFSFNFWKGPMGGFIVGAFYNFGKAIFLKKV